MVSLPQMPRLVSLVLLATIIVVVGLTFYRVVAPFLMPLFLAGILALLCRPLYRRLVAAMPKRPSLAAGLATVLVLSIILVPLSLGTISAARQLYKLARTATTKTDWSKVAAKLRDNATVQFAVHHYNEWASDPVNLDELEQEVESGLRSSSETLAKKTLGFAGSTLSFLGSVVSAIVSTLTFVIALYYFFADGPRLIVAIERLVPVHRDYQRQLLAQFDRAVRGVVLATFAAALAQGLATAVGMLVAGYQHFFLVLILATLTALVPLLGTWLVWGPYVLWLGVHDGNWMAASLLAIWGIVFIGVLDNFIRAWVLHSNVKLHPLLAFVSVLGGIEVMGLWGVFIGPIVASCLYALVRIFNTELVAFSQQSPVGDSDGPGRTDPRQAEPSRVAPSAPIEPPTAQPGHAGPAACAIATEVEKKSAGHTAQNAADAVGGCPVKS